MVTNSQNYLEIINADILRGQIKFALFDFDGTLSLIRQGWEAVMIPLMVEILAQAPHAEDNAQLEAIATDFVSELTGKQTIFQMIRLAEEVAQRGGSPADPLVYKKMYLDRLDVHIKDRVAGLKNGTIAAEAMLVPGSMAILRALRERGVTCYLASGTDQPFVLAEAESLRVTPYFAGIYGALDNYQDFSKRMVIEQIIAENNLAGRELVAFGDGFVEIEETKKAGGIAVGLATDEEARQGINQWKRRRLVKAGADVIVPDFNHHQQLVDYLFASD